MKFVPRLVFLLVASATVLFHADDASAQKLHVVIVALTDDFNLGDLCQKDISDVTGMFSGKVPDDQLNFVIIEGARANRATVINEVSALAVGRDDAVLFYYSGHGFIDQNNRNYMYLQDQSKLYAYEAQNLVSGKSPRLSALLFDMCSAPDTPPLTAKEYAAMADAAPAPRIVIPPLIDALFFKARGTAVIIGSSPGELGQSDPKRIRGGLFTYCFTDTIRKNLQTPFGWEPIFNAVRGKVQQEFQRNWPGGMDLARATGGQLRGTQATQTPVAYELPGRGNGGTVNPGGGGSTPPPPPPPANGPVFGATALNYNGPGVFISQVVPNGPAGQAGLEPRDVILEINGRRISSEADFGQAIDASGRDMHMTIQNWRDGSTIRIQARLNK